MFDVYFDGKKVGQLAVPPEFQAALSAKPELLEIRNDSGESIGKYVPQPICPWDTTLTREELDRRSAAGGGIPLAEFWKRMGVE